VTTLLEAARHSEFLLFGAVKEAPEKKVLLARETARSDVLPDSRLRLIRSSKEWAQYEDERLLIEQAYGLSPTEVATVVQHMKRSTSRHPIGWHFYEVDQAAVGAVGFFEFAFAGQPYCRLQDVDVFPRFRGRGYGNGLLQSCSSHAAACGAKALVVGADEDDWPLQWYIRHQFVPLCQAPKASHAALSQHDA
jgi:GNAT superfamily N-acetyltransferase